MSARRIPPIVTLALSSAITSLDFTIIYLAIPRIQADFGASIADAQWVAAVYAVAYGGFLLLGGRLADAYSSRRCFVAGLMGFGVSSVVGALAPSLAVLLIGRVGQGLSAALLFPATLALLHQLYPDDRGKRRSLSVWAAAGSGGLITGTILGGILTDLTDWRGVMWVNVPLVFVGLTLTAASLPAISASAATHRIGAASWSSSVAVAVLAGSVCLLAVRAETWRLGWPTWTVLAIMLVAVLVARGLVRTGGATLVSARVLGDSNVRTATALGTVFMGAFGAVYFLLSLDLQAVRGIPPTLTGIAMIPGSLGGIIGSFLAARLLAVRSPRAIASLAMIAGGIGLAAIAAAAAGPLLLLLASLGLASIAQGVAYASIFALAGHGVAPEEQGVATGVVSTGQQIGSAVGLAVAAICVQSMTVASPAGVEAGIVLALALGAAAVLATGVLARVWPIRLRHEQRRVEPS